MDEPPGAGAEGLGLGGLGFHILPNLSFACSPWVRAQAPACAFVYESQVGYTLGFRWLKSGYPMWD